MGSSGLISEDKPQVEDTSLTKLFEEQCPIYMAYGMEYNDFWYGDAYLTKFYRESHKLKVKQKDEELWMQGMYIYEALCDVAPIFHAFAKRGTKPVPYTDHPYSITNKEREAEKDRKIKQEQEKAKQYMLGKMAKINKRFESK